MTRKRAGWNVVMGLVRYGLFSLLVEERRLGSVCFHLFLLDSFGAAGVFDEQICAVYLAFQ